MSTRHLRPTSFFSFGFAAIGSWWQARTLGPILFLCCVIVGQLSVSVEAYALQVPATGSMRYIYFINTLPHYTSSPEAACRERNQYWVDYNNSLPNQLGTHSYQITNINLFDGGLNGTGFGGFGMVAYMVGSCETLWIITSPVGTFTSPGSIALWMEPPICPPGFRFILATRMCDDGATNYSIEIQPVGTAPESASVLASVEPLNATSRPGNETVQLVAQVRNEAGNLVPDVAVSINVRALPGTGGHDAAVHTGTRPTGTLRDTSAGASGSTIAGSTGPAGGGFVFSFTAPEPAGDHEHTASCMSVTCNQTGPRNVWVGVKDLVSLYETRLYRLIGSDNAHPSNHYLTISATGSVVWLAELYRAMFPNDPPLHLNDASLERGGIFDIDWVQRDASGNVVAQRTIWWTRPHIEHRRGTVVDVRANGASTAIPQRNFADFEELLANRLGMTFLRERLNQSGGHYHVRLLGVAQ